MQWELDILYYDEDQNKAMKSMEATSKTPFLGPAIEECLHKLKLSGQQRGSYQITVTMR